jgi:hypothetical protein
MVARSAGRHLIKTAIPINISSGTMGLPIKVVPVFKGGNSNGQKNDGRS